MLITISSHKMFTDICLHLLVAWIDGTIESRWYFGVIWNDFENTLLFRTEDMKTVIGSIHENLTFIKNIFFFLNSKRKVISSHQNRNPINFQKSPRDVPRIWNIKAYILAQFLLKNAPGVSVKLYIVKHLYPLYS